MFAISNATLYRPQHLVTIPLKRVTIGYDSHLNPLQPSKSRKAIPYKIYNIGNLIYEVLNLPYSITTVFLQLVNLQAAKYAVSLC